MSEQTSNTIKGKIVVSAARVMLAWLLLVVLPIIGSLGAFDFFLAEYAHFTEPDKIAEAFNKLELYKKSLVVENFLESKLSVLKALQPKGNSLAQLEIIKNKIDSLIGGKSLLCVFFNKERQQVKTIQFKPPGMQSITFPPAALLKRQIQFLFQLQIHQPESVSQDKELEPEKFRNALSLQQLFKTIAPITLSTGKVVKNFSIQFGGDLYFIYFEFTGNLVDPAGCLVVLRGQEFSTRFMLQDLKSEFPFCRVVNREMDIVKIEAQPELLNSGISRLNDRILITSSAEQRFIRHVLHGGGVSLLESENRLMPFIQYHLPLTSLQHHLAEMRQLIRIIATILLGISGLYCLLVSFFGVNLATSFKKRIMGTTLLAALFPFTFFAASFYLHLQYDEFLGKITLIQHINTRLSLLNSELDQYFAGLEGTLSIYLQQITRKNFDDDAAIMRLFETIGKVTPITRISLQKANYSLKKEFENRTSITVSNDSNAAIEDFFPTRTLQLLTEPEPLDRTRQDILKIPGQSIRITLIAKSLISNGSFHALDQAKFLVWMSNYKVVDNEAHGKPVLGLLICRFETSPLLQDFFRQSRFAKSGYQENYGNYLIKYAFFPTERTGSPFIWAGSGNTNIPTMRKGSERQRSETIVSQNAGGSEEFLISKMNHSVPHIALAIAQPLGGSSVFKTSVVVGVGSILYLVLVLVFAGKLLDSFFVSPVIELARSAELIARGSDRWALKLTTGDEFEALNNSFSDMVKGLQQRNMLRNYVSTDAYSDIETAGTQSLIPSGEYREATVIFAAIKDYQTITEGFSPQQTIELLNSFTTIGDNIVKEHHGSIDKILNQTLMLVFRESSDDQESHALRAAKTAIKLADAAKAQNLPGIYAGIASGTVISGKIGSYQGKLDFTVIGNPVNLAARLKAEAADSNTGIIISGSTMRLLKGKGRVQFLRRCSLKGKSREYNIYELCDLREI